MLTVSARPAKSGEGIAFDLCQAQGRAIVAVGEHVEHVAIEDETGPIRFDVVRGSMLSGPVQLTVSLSCNPDLRFKLDTLARLTRLGGMAGAARWRAGSDKRLSRLVEALRVGDALREGASLREIASVLLGAERVRCDWPGAGDSIKSWVRRRVALARRLRSAGPAAILQHRI